MILHSFIFANEISYSNVDSNSIPLDHKIAERLARKNGVFIEAGAFDGIQQSNTKLLEDFYGWTGLLVEPSPSVQKRLKSNRPHSICYSCALGSFEQNYTYLCGDFTGELMSSIGGERSNKPPKECVLIRSLQSILDEVALRHIDFFSLDVEGYELNVLHGIDFNKTSFDFILIEIYKKDFNNIVTFLKSKGYHLIENLSNYNIKTNPNWDGSHNDYLFENKQVLD